MKNLRMVTPILNDWTAFLALLQEPDQVRGKPASAAALHGSDHAA
jgi:hypothetical protein